MLTAIAKMLTPRAVAILTHFKLTDSLFCVIQRPPLLRSDHEKCEESRAATLRRQSVHQMHGEKGPNLLAVLALAQRMPGAHCVFPGQRPILDQKVEAGNDSQSLRLIDTSATQSVS